MEMASPEIATSVCNDVVSSPPPPPPSEGPDVTVTQDDPNTGDHPSSPTGGAAAAAAPAVSPVAEPAGARQTDEDGIHLAPDGAGSPDKAKAMGAAERRSSFVQMEGRARSRSVGEKQWTRVRAVMAWYTRLRRIKKEPDVVPNGEGTSSSQAANAPAVPSASHDPSSIEGRSRSAQRWMKLRTTVQLTSAITSTVAQSKKTSLKREDSFIARFSTRQIPEAQETFDATDEGGSSSGGNGGSGTCSGGLAHLGDKSGGVGGAANGTGAPVKRRRRHQKPPRSVLNPDENGLFYWLAFLALWVLYNLWTIVVRLAFPELHHEDNLHIWNVCDALGDAAYVLDIAVQFRTGYLEQGIMVHDSRKLAIHYVRSKSFLIDMMSLLPIDWMLLPQQLADPVLARWRPACRFLRLIKLYRVFAFYYVVESRTVYPNAWRVVNLVHILLMLAHWFGCFYFLLSESEGFQSDWSYPYPEGDFATLTRKYLGSLYWSTLTLTTIGDLPTPETNADRPRKPNRPQGGGVTTSTSRSPTGWSGNYSNVSRWNVGPGSGAGVMSGQGYSGNGDGLQALPRRGLKSRILHHSTNQGYIFTIASYLIGVFIFATIVGQVGNVITNRNASRLEFERLLDTAKLYMRHHKVPRSMQRRVQRWYDYSWSRGRIQGGGDTSSALRILPDKLKTELALHVNLATLKKVSIFKECQPEFLHDLVLKMRASIFTPGDMICRRGEVAREMFIIADGILEVISETGKVLTSMKAGDFFGEIGILNLDGLNKRTADVRSVGYAELFSLSREDVLSAMKDYPEAEEILLNLGRKRLIEARKMASQHRAQMARKGLLALERAAQLRAQQEQAANSGGLGMSASASAGLDGAGQSVTSRFTDRIRSDVFGLKKAIRKSFKESRRPKSDSPTIEMGTYGGVGSTFSGGLSKASSVPLGNATLSRSGSCTKASLLRRMANVTSDDAQVAHNSSSEDCRLTKPLLQKPESPVEVIGAGLPLFQRLKLLRQRELEKEKQQQQQQQQLQQQQQQQEGEQAKTKENEPEASQSTQEVAVTIESECGESKSPPPVPGTSSQRDDKQPRHITFLDEAPSHKKRDYVPPDPPKPRGGKSARWTLAVLPGRSNTGSKTGRPRLLNTIMQASSSSSALDSLEQAEPPPPPPPPLPPTPPFWQPKASSPLLRSGVPPPRPPAPHFPGLNIRGRKKLPRRALTMRPEDTPSSLQDSDVPYRPVQQFRSMMKQPWHRSGIDVTADSPPPPPPPPTSSSTSKFSRQMTTAGATPTSRRFSRQNTIQVVSDVQGVLSDILRDIVPSSGSKSSSRAVTKPLINPVLPPSEATSYGTMRAPVTNSNTNWESVRQETLVSDRPPQRPQRLNLRQCKNRSSRDYNSIDDLSPEYTVLPFVKRLKILNERQKIVELQKALTTTASSSMASGSGSRDVTGSATTSKNPSASTSPIAALLDADKGTVAESNETPERVCLKKMLKSASRKELIPKDQTQRIKLLRSQTVEGYAVRHANFTKLNHQRLRNNHRIAQTLPSPPSVPFDNQDSPAPVDAPHPPTPLLLDPDFNALVPDKRKLSLLKTEHEGVKEECVAELLTAIKTVLQERLDEIQARFQAQIHLLQSEVEQKDQLISRLQLQLTSLGVQPVLPVPADETQSDREEQTSSVDSDAEEEDDDDSRTLRYFARSFSKGSFIHLEPPSPTSPIQGSASGSRREHSPCPSIDDMLDSAAEELPTTAVLDPEPLWQLEFGSCWQRMHTNTAAITSNPRDLVLDMEESSFSSTSSEVDQAPSSSSSSRLKKRTMSLDVSSSKRHSGSKTTHGRSETLPTEGPYFPDWEILMLAESLDRDVEDDGMACESAMSSDKTSLGIPAVTRRRRSLRSSASVDPQSMSSAKSKKMIEKWHWSYPPPNQEEPTDYSAKHDGGK